MSQVKLTADSGGGTTSLKAPSSTTSNADVVLKLPVADGSANQVLKTDGSGQLSFTSNAGTTINNNADNRVITGSGTASTLEGEANLTWNGTEFHASGSSGTPQLTIENTSNSAREAALKVIGRHSNGTVRQLMLKYDNADRFRIHTGGSIPITFETTDTERMRIDSSGRVGIGDSSPDRELVVKNASSNSSIKIEASNAHTSQLFFSDTDTENVARISVFHGSGSDQNSMLFGTAGSTRLAITSAGKVGIGTISPNTLLHIRDTAISQGYGSQSSTLLALEDSGDTSFEIASGHNNTSSVFFGDTGASNKGQINYHNGTGGDAMSFHANGSERMRIDSSGLLKVGSTTNTDIYNTSGTGNEGAWLVPGGASQFAISNTVVCRMNRKTSNGKILAFYYNGSEVGTISTNANSLPSDRNFKTNISDLNLGLSLVKKLKPSQYNYKIDNDNTPVMYGLIAQELEESLTSEGITKNSTQLIQHHPTDNSESDYDVDYTKLVPILINSIKELATKLEALETKVAALEAA